MGKASLRPGDVAPDFVLPDQNGTTVRLSDFRGKRTVVLAFYIKAFTSG
jgi:peroxiredoxin